MPLTTTTKMLLDAGKNGYAVAAFNVENMEMMQAVVAAGEEMNAPLILQTTPSTVRYATVELFFANAAALAEKSGIPIALHLDHGSSFSLAESALRAGYTSIMIDGSHLPFKENIAFTRETVELCEKAGIPVEGELGRVGGKEDDTESKDEGYVNPEEALLFVKETGVSSLAIGIGTAHGVYTVKPVLKPELISIIKSMVDIPLVLHGSSGLEDDVIKDCIKRGISKVNIATDLRIIYTRSVREYLELNPGCIDPKKFGAEAREAVKRIAMERIMVCGCQGHAN